MFHVVRRDSGSAHEAKVHMPESNLLGDALAAWGRMRLEADAEALLPEPSAELIRAYLLRELPAEVSSLVARLQLISLKWTIATAHGLRDLRKENEGGTERDKDS